MLGVRRVCVREFVGVFSGSFSLFLSPDIIFSDKITFAEISRWELGSGSDEANRIPPRFRALVRRLPSLCLSLSPALPKPQGGGTQAYVPRLSWRLSGATHLIGMS